MNRRASACHDTTRKFADMLAHFGALITQAGYNHAMAEYNSDLSRTSGSAPNAPPTPPQPLDICWAEPPSSGGPGEGLDTDIPGLLNKIKVPVPDGDTDKLSLAGDAWDQFAKDDAIVGVPSKIKAISAMFATIRAPEVQDIEDHLRTLQTGATQIEDCATKLAKDCKEHKDALDHLRTKINHILIALGVALGVTITVAIAATVVSGGISDATGVAAGGGEMHCSRGGNN